MKQYQDLIRHIMANGVDKGDRTGTGTRSVFGYQMRFNLQDGFPMVTTKFTPFKTMAKEMFWFLTGQCYNVKTLQEQGVHIWDEWARPDGGLGPIYGCQWRDWVAYEETRTPNRYRVNVVDQIARVIETLKTTPDDRRMIVTAWNVAELELMALPPCHIMFQFYTRPGPNGRRLLDCQLYQRSCDVFLGVPFNIASYALLMHLIAHIVDMGVGEFVWTGGDVHVYSNHFEQVEILLQREPLPLPTLEVLSDAPKDIDMLLLEHVVLKNYRHHDKISAPVAV